MILNFTVEDYVLGCLLNNPEYRDKLLVIPEDAWTVPEYKEIFKVMRDMYFKKTKLSGYRYTTDVSTNCTGYNKFYFF